MKLFVSYQYFGKSGCGIESQGFGNVRLSDVGEPKSEEDFKLLKEFIEVRAMKKKGLSDISAVIMFYRLI